MSRSVSASTPGRSSEASTHGGQQLVAETNAEALLDALDDADCRTILDATADEALSAKEVSETCDIPLSTTYRKLDLLTEAGLLEERTRVRRSRKHTSEYVAVVKFVVISLDTRGELELQVSRCEHGDHIGPAALTAGE